MTFHGKERNSKNVTCAFFFWSFRWWVEGGKHRHLSDPSSEFLRGLDLGCNLGLGLGRRRRFIADDRHGLLRLSYC